MAEALTTAERMSDRYLNEIRGRLQEDLGLSSVMQVPKLVKIVVNMGVGAATQQAKLLEGAVADLAVITGQKPVITKASEIPKTMGDEAGTLKGLSSGTNMDKATFKLGVPKVKFEGNDAVNLMKMTAQNGASANAPAGNVVAPSQTKVLIAG